MIERGTLGVTQVDRLGLLGVALGQGVAQLGQELVGL